MRNSDVSVRISMLRFLMIFGVLLVHTPPTLEVYELDGTFWGYFVSFFQNGVFKAGVPVLTVISGFLLFSANSDMKYVALLKRKANSLLIPFMVFNLGHIGLQIGLRFATGRWLGENLFGQSFDEWMSSLFGLWSAPENNPLHFLRELIVLVVLSPFYGFLIRKMPSLGFVAISIFFLNNFDGYLINRSDMAVEFYVGGLAAVYKWNLKALDKFCYASLVVFCGACAAVTIFKITDITLLRLIAPILVWSAVSPLVNTRLGKWIASLSIYSFFLYLTHAPLMRIIWIVFQKVLPSVPVPLFTAIAPIVVTVLCIGLYKKLTILIPHLFDWTLGGRSEKAAVKTQPLIVASGAEKIVDELEEENISEPISNA